ncbi:MAG: glycoside hydrolase family 3 protein [Lachnospiraceae bacterium]|jgi:beta-glucosidase
MNLNEYEIRHNNYLRANGGECAVLLKSNGDFPLSDACEIALFGSGARRTIKGGTGSGEVNSRFFVSIEQGLEDNGFRITTKKWLDAYDRICIENRKEFVKQVKAEARKKFKLAVFSVMGKMPKEPEYVLPIEHEGVSKAAVYVLARSSGEGNDRKFIEGDVKLTETEIRDIIKCSEKYEKFLLVLNVGGVVDLTPVSAVENILIISQLGVETGHILADLLVGKSYPSGKLTTTWAAVEEYCTVGDFGGKHDTCYKEGIYVGYRYFSSVGKKPMFPFGFGKGYTSFEIGEVKVRKCEECADIFHVSACVRNKGAFPGKEVLQVYVSSPEGKLDRPYQALAGFAKSGEIAPGASEEVIVSFKLSDIASYDTETERYVIEKGDHIVRLGTSSVDTSPVAIIKALQDITVLQVKNLLGDSGFRDWTPDDGDRYEVKGSLENLTVFEIGQEMFAAREINYEPDYEIDPVIESLTDEQLIKMNVGAHKKGGAIGSVIGNAGFSVAGAAGETFLGLKEKGIPSLVMADGPAGVRISQRYVKDETGVYGLGASLPDSISEFIPKIALKFIGKVGGKIKEGQKVYEQYATAMPIGTAIAQSWNLSFAQSCGDIVGEEMELFGIHLWLAPALNIHRDIRCGRNFEYYSEDPLISGKMTAAVTKGVQSHPGCGVTIKHFCANNQEFNRNFNCSHVSERAMREIYMRGFEIAIRESNPAAVMTSYNLLNGTHTSELRNLTEGILRAEYGFEGIVMTDWVISASVMRDKDCIYRQAQAGLVAAAGGDLFMPGSEVDCNNIKHALEKGIVTKKQLQINATRVYRMILKLSER